MLSEWLYFIWTSKFCWVVLRSMAREQRFIKNIFFYFEEAILRWDKMLHILCLPSVDVTGSVELAWNFYYFERENIPWKFKENCLNTWSHRPHQNDPWLEFDMYLKYCFSQSRYSLLLPTYLNSNKNSGKLFTLCGWNKPISVVTFGYI